MGVRLTDGNASACARDPSEAVEVGAEVGDETGWMEWVVCSCCDERVVVEGFLCWCR
jgi:hypothetical protein